MCVPLCMLGVMYHCTDVEVREQFPGSLLFSFIMCGSGINSSSQAWQQTLSPLKYLLGPD